jgi:hypothetical protein
MNSQIKTAQIIKTLQAIRYSLALTRAELAKNLQKNI